MALSSFRIVSIAVPVGKEEVVVTMYEEYAEDNPGVPIHIKVVGPNGLMTEGKPAAAWQEMLALLGAVPKKPPVRTQHSGMSDCAKLIIEKGEPAAHGLVFAEDGKNSASEQDLQSHEPEVRQVSPEDRNSYIEQKTQRQSQNMAEAGSPASADVAVAGVQEAAGSPVVASHATTSIQNQNCPLRDDIEDDMELEEEREEDNTDVELEPALNRNIFQESMLRLLSQQGLQRRSAVEDR